MATQQLKLEIRPLKVLIFFSLPCNQPVCYSFREELAKCQNHLKALEDELQIVEKEIMEADNNKQKYVSNCLHLNCRISLEMINHLF